MIRGIMYPISSSKELRNESQMNPNHFNDLFEDLKRRTDFQHAYYSTPQSARSIYKDYIDPNQPIVETNTGSYSSPRDIYEDWGRHYNEKSGQYYFSKIIRLVEQKLLERGLYCRSEMHNDETAVFVVSYDTPGATEQKFVLINEDNKHYRWKLVSKYS